MLVSQPSVDQTPWIYRIKLLSRYTMLYIFKATFGNRAISTLRHCGQTPLEMARRPTNLDLL